MSKSLTADAIMNLQAILPVLTIGKAQNAAPLAETFLANGLRVMEVTLRTDAALEAISEMAAIPDIVIGAGTILNTNDVKAAIGAGAQFIVTPGLTRAVAAACQDADIPIFAGVSTASEIMTGLEMGLDRFKFFPAEQAGGVAMLKALAGPFANVRFCPTGGITAETSPDYLALPNVAMVGGGWVAPQKLVDAGDWDAIDKLAKKAAAITRG